MKKIGVISGIVGFFMGCLTLIVTGIIKEIMPKYGYAMYQSAAAGSYTESNYYLNFTFPIVIACILMAAGLVLALLCATQKPANTD